MEEFKPHIKDISSFFKPKQDQDLIGVLQEILIQVTEMNRKFDRLSKIEEQLDQLNRQPQISPS